MSISTDNMQSNFTTRQKALTVPNQPVIKYWALAGAILLAFELWVLFQWVTGPHFAPVPSGPDLPPVWMRIVFRTTEVVSVIGMFACIYFFLVKPWIRERRVTTDGLLFTALVFASPWDNLSNYLQYWFTYNSYLVNFGSPMAELPGSLAYRAPGVSDAYPILAIPFIYSAAFMWLAMLICWALRKAKARWPNMNNFQLVCLAIVIAALFDVVLEGMIYMPLGFWTYVGGHWNINAGKYYQYPLHEALMAGIMNAAFSLLRYFVNDKGETLVERGLEHVKGSQAYKTSLRFLAMIGGVHIIFIFLFHMPVGFTIAPNSAKWIDDSVNRSYFMNNICGPKVDRACPGPDVPIHRPGTPYLDFQGNWRFDENPQD